MPASEPLPQPVWPEAGHAVVDLVGQPAAAAAVPSVQVAPPGQGEAPDTIRVESLGTDTARRIGGHGLAVRLQRADGRAEPGRATLTLDYSGFRYAYGGDFAARLHLVALPACVLERPDDTTCNQGTPVEGVRNDLEHGHLVAEVPVAGDPAAEGAEAATVYLVTAAASGSAGTYEATPLSPSTQWQAGDNSGNLTWTYPIPLPPSPYGDTPELALEYSSASVDGKTVATNSQASWVGLGWQLTPPFIERRYRSCADDKDGSVTPGSAYWNDTCWATDNAYLSFGNHSGELIRTPGDKNVWRLKDDPGWRIVRLSGAANGDSDGEYWRIDTPDGTQYYFGRGKAGLDPATSPDTNSVFRALVVGDDPGEPCHVSGNLPGSHCHQAWRWNLDMVVDANGNRVIYTYRREQSFYHRTVSGKNAVYDRGGYLTQIDYGLREGTRDDSAVRVVFDVTSRCVQIDGEKPCPVIGEANASSYPDVPVDLLCYENSCKQKSQSYFTTARLKSITTQVRDGTEYRDVDHFYLEQSFPRQSDGTNASLWLNRITRKGRDGDGEIVLPPVRFFGTELPNRLDANPSAGVPPLRKYRLTKVVNELGGVTEISYGQPNKCTSVPSNARTNRGDCFPQYFKPEGAAPGWAWFHKYLVTAVTETPNYGSTPRTTSYSYAGGAAWRHDNDPLYPDSENRESWSDWRGYERVTVTTGSSVTTTVYYRGMNGDKGASGTVYITDLDGNQFPDYPNRSGRPLHTRHTSGDTVLEDVHYDYWAHMTAQNPLFSYRDAYLVRTKSVHTKERKRDGTFREHRVQTRYDTTFGLPIWEWDEGDLAVPDDSTCTRTVYAVDTGTGWMALPARESGFADDLVEEGDTSCSGPEVSRSDTYYDGHDGLTDPPTDGNATRVDNWTSETDAITTRTAYDEAGRVVESIDGNGGRSTTTYSPATGWPTEVVTTDPLGNTTRTRTSPARGQELERIDVNGRSTRLRYDQLGRLTEVRLPGTDDSAAADRVFTYDVAQDRPSRVSSSTLHDRADGAYITSHTFVDGLGRTLETQTASPQEGQRIVVQTRYDDRGQVAAQTAPLNMTGEPGSDLANPQVDAIPSEVRTSYDALGRVTEEALWSLGTRKWGTTTQWWGDQHVVTPPTGKPTTYVVDVFDRVVRTEETLDSGVAVTHYEYSPRGELVRITDAKGNVSSHTYDWLGRRLESRDPDTGTSTAEYDGNGNIVRTVDARGVTVVSVYDALNRRTQLRRDSETGPLLAEWIYDPAGHKGLLDRSVRYTPDTPDPEDNYVVAHRYDDVRDRLVATTWTIPAAEGVLAGSYTQSFTYDDADRVATITYPAVGGLPEETVTQHHDALGQPVALSSPLGQYVVRTAFTPDGKLAGRDLGRDSDPYRVSRSYTYDTATGRVTGMRAVLGGTTLLQDDVYVYDPVGNTTRIADQVTQQRQCFAYDGRNRLTHAWTTGVDCTDGETPDSGFGPDPYDLRYTYDEIGNITSVTDKGVRRSYTYPASGPDSVRPHAVTAVGSDTYEYDAGGNMTRRVVGGVESTFTWDEQHGLVEAVVGDRSTAFVYDAEGNRLIRREEGSTLLTVAGTEVTATGQTVTATRYYTLDGTTVALRRSGGEGGADGTVHWLLGDAQGSARITVNAVTGASSQQRYTPFGAHRGEGDPLGEVTERGFLGKTEDDTTGLVHLGARYYDPVIGRFLSPDPLQDPQAPQSLNGYTYGNNNPATFSDPSGLLPCYSPDLPCGMPSYGGGKDCTFCKPSPSKPKNGTKPGSGGGKGIWKSIVSFVKSVPARISKAMARPAPPRTEWNLTVNSCLTYKVITQECLANKGHPTHKNTVFGNFLYNLGDVMANSADIVTATALTGGHISSQTAGKHPRLSTKAASFYSDGLKYASVMSDYFAAPLHGIGVFLGANFDRKAKATLFNDAMGMFFMGKVFKKLGGDDVMEELVYRTMAFGGKVDAGAFDIWEHHRIYYGQPSNLSWLENGNPLEFYIVRPVINAWREAERETRAQ